MTLLDRLRSRPRWQHPDASVRAESVRQIPAQEQALLYEIARDDADPRVRRAALRKLSDPRALAERLAAEVDVEAREQGAEALQAWAAGEDEAAAEVALAALGDPRRLALLARSARIAAVRRGALARIEDPHLLLTLAKAANDPGVRSQALARLQDEALLAEVAAKTEHRDVAMAAVDRIDDTRALDGIAVHARQKAASRRARARLELLRPQTAAPPLVDPLEPRAEDAPTSANQRAPALALSEMGVDPAADVNPRPILAVAPSASGESVPCEPANAGLEAAPSAAADPAGEELPTAPEEARSLAGEVRERERRRAGTLCARLEALGAKKALTLREAQAALREARALHVEGPGSFGKLIPRLKAARAALFARAQELRDADDWSRWGNAALQEELCGRLETLATRDDFERVARELREADARWAQFREVPKDQAETLRQRYQAARAVVKARLDAYFSQKGEAEARHLEEKQALCARAEALADSSDWLRASVEIKALQARWKEIGAVPHRRSEGIWQRFRTACDRFFSRRHEDLLRRKAEWAGNLLRKEELCTRAELLAQSSEWDASAAELKRLQAAWQAVGPVRRNKAEGVWQRFRAACDVFFERYKNRDALALAAKRAEREALCAELDALAAAEAQEGLLRRTQDLQTRWRQAPRLGKDDELLLEKRFSEARTRLLETHAETFRGSELDPDIVRTRKEKLLERLEALGAPAPGAETLSGEDLARRLMEALAGNTIGGAERSDAQRKAELEEAEAARSAWAKLPALAGDVGEALERRFRDACARFFSERAPTALPRSGRVSPRAKPARTSRASRTP